MDILPTIRDFLGLPRDSTNVGKSLTPFWGKGDTELEGRVIFSHLTKYIKNKITGAVRQHVSRAVIFNKWQAINSIFPTRKFLFDWQNDPLEKTNLHKTEKFMSQRLKAKFLQFEAKCYKLLHDMKVIDLNAEKIRELKTLGYM